MTPKTASTFRIEDDLLDAMREIKERDGVPISVQVRKAIELWLESKGVKKSGPRRAATRRKA